MEGKWLDGSFPAGVHIGVGSLLTGPMAFKRFYSRLPDALTIGEQCTLDGVQFATGPEGKIVIGRNCYMNNAIMLAELSVEIGNYVMVGWNVTIADSDFHPIDPALRIDDAIACSPLAAGRQRPPVEKAPVRVGNDVYIGPGVVVLKGVQIGDRAFIEPGSVVTRDVPPDARVMGNPARIMEG